MKIFCENKEAEKSLNEQFEWLGNCIDALIIGGAKSCCFHFHRNKVVSVMNSVDCDCSTTIHKDHFKVDITDLTPAIRRVAMILLYNKGFKGKDLAGFDVAVGKEKPDWRDGGSVYDCTHMPPADSWGYQGASAIASKCECGAEKAHSSHSTWCPKWSK